MLNRPGVKWGAILGLGVVVWTLVIHALGFYTTRIAAGLIADNVATVLPLITVVMAILERRRRSGFLTIGQAVGTGAIVGLVSAPITVGFLWIYHHFVNPEWVDYLVSYARVQGQSSGQSAAQIEERILALRHAGSDQAQIVGGLLGSVMIATVIGLLAGVLLRRKQRSPLSDSRRQ